ncbi:MAG: spermidine/putrescine ABC transporter permease PotB [Candidatus Latescibacterota bacterium]|jgi:spermidine/putrescine transport system permease protein
MAEQSPFRTVAIGTLALWLALFVLAPTLLVIGTSLLARDEVDLVAPRFSLEAWARLLDPVYLAVFLRSAGLALAATALCLGLGYPFAYLLARARPDRRPLLLLLVIIPFWTNSLVRTYAVRTVLAARGPLNALLQALGLTDAPVALLYNGLAVVVGLLYVMLPFMVLPLYAVLEKLDRSLLEAAADLGAGRLQVLLRVVFPLSLPGVVAGCVLVFLPSLGMFFVSDLLGGARDLLMGNFIKEQFLDARDWPFGAAASVAMTALMALLLLVWRASQRRTGLPETTT